MKVLNIMSGGLRREGITTTQLEFLRHMDRDGLQIDIGAVTKNDPKVIAEFEEIGCRVIVFPDRKKKLPAYVRALYRQIKKEKYDVLHVHGSSTLLTIELLTAKLAGVPVRIAHSRNTQCDHNTVNRLLRPLFLSCCTHALACGEEAGQWLFGSRPFTIVHNGKDLESFRFDPEKRRSIREQYGLGDAVAVGFVGNIIEQKNVPFLLEVFHSYLQSCPNARLFVIGEGDLRQQMEEKAAQLGMADRVTFTGRIYNVPELLHGMDMMLLPSLFEGLPNVVLEWQAAGLPSLVSDRVTKECKVCDLVTFLPVDQGMEVWTEQMAQVHRDNRVDASRAGCESLSRERFEINGSAAAMREYYFNAVKGVKP